jgi:copper chaperone CopZ
MKSTFKQITSLILFLFFVGFFNSTEAKTFKQKELIYVKIEIKGMACSYCAFGMEKELRRLSGVNLLKINLEAGLAFISTPITQKPTKESIYKIILDAGFTVGEIEYSPKPFKN